MGILRQTTNVILSNKLIQHYMGSGFLYVNSLSQEEISFKKKLCTIIREIICIFHEISLHKVPVDFCR